MRRKGRKAKVLTNERIDILMLLTDDLGHPAWFIAEQLVKEPSNLSPIINTLVKPFKVLGWDCVIDPQDISNPKSLISKILSGKDEICEYIKHLNYPQDFASITDEQLSIYCAKSLNDFVFSVNTYDDKSFSATKRKIIDNFDAAIDVYYSHGKVLGFPILNRSLLSIIFKGEIAKSNSPILYRVRQPTSRPLLEESNRDEKRCYINKNLHIFDFITMNLANLLKKDLSPSYSPVFIATSTTWLT
jgi:hypothetical protein